MTDTDLRGEIAKSMWEHDNPQDKNAIKIKFDEYPKDIDFIQAYYRKADFILTLIRQAVSAVKPKELYHPKSATHWQEHPNIPEAISYNKGVSDYHDALMEVLS